MPGTFGMENGTQNGVRNNHDRDSWTTGVGDYRDKGKAVGEGSGTMAVVKMDEGPDELEHITDEMVPLDLFLTRLAQYSHSILQDELVTLASKPLPQNLPNGNTSHHGGGAEDTSPESLEKKTHILNFLQALHTKWVKALVITEWSKKADQVGKLIDIRTHLARKLDLFITSFGDLMNLNWELHCAKLPSPDLKTALEVLTNGEVSWMPEFGYIAPRPLSPEAQQTWAENLNTLLSARLSLAECERIPQPFKDYKIENGRVTFTVPGEFEVDLTVSDEDFETQFWFLDFRFLFRPAPPEFSPSARIHLDRRVNDILGTEGLAGCYKYLHELTLTAKITEYSRQAARLSAARWAGAIKIERLGRALAIQYWVNRPHSKTTKSWIILGVDNAGKDSDGVHDPKHQSGLNVRWFRDNQEVKDFDISFDLTAISAENLLTAVVARHVEYLLESIYTRLAKKPRFSNKHARLRLDISPDVPSDTALTVQLLGDDKVSIHVDQYTGAFSMLPRSPAALEGQRLLNSSANPAEQGANALEHLRYHHIIKKVKQRAGSLGWALVRSPVSSQDELKSIIGSQSRESYQVLWMKKTGWGPQWFVMMSMSLGGDHWWLVELSGQRQGPSQNRVKMFTKMPMSTDQLRLSDTFFQNLAVFATGMASQITDLRELHSKRIIYKTSENVHFGAPEQVKVPTVNIRLSALLLPRTGPKAAVWAQEYVPVVFKGIQSSSEVPEPQPQSDPPQQRETSVEINAEAQIAVKNHLKLQLQQVSIDSDVLYDSKRGLFTLRLRSEMGRSLVNLLTARVQALERLIDLVEAIRRAGDCVVPRSVSLREVVFTYATKPREEEGQKSPESLKQWRVRLDLAGEKGAKVLLDAGNPHLRVIDFIQAMANSSALEQLPCWLVNTLPLYRALEKLYDGWDSFDNQRYCAVFHKSLNWATIRFSLPGPPQRRVVNIEIKPHTRKGKLMWYVSRAETDPNAKNENEEFNRILRQRVWSAKGEDGITGLVTSAAVSLDTGIEKIIALIDESIRLLPVVTIPTSQQGGQQQQQQQQQQLHGQDQSGGGGGGPPPPGVMQKIPLPGRLPPQQQQGQRPQQVPQANMGQVPGPQQQQQQQHQRANDRHNNHIMVLD